MYVKLAMKMTYFQFSNTYTAMMTIYTCQENTTNALTLFHLFFQLDVTNHL